MSQNSEKTLDRRDFLKKTGVALVGSAAILAGCSTEKKDKKKTRFAMLIDLKKCYGCHSCSIACKSQWDVPLGVWRNRVKVSERGKYPNVKRNFLPVLCNQCENPPCVPVCPTGATFQKDNGIVVVNEDDCVGCKYCIQNCPYDNRFIHPIKGVANKCDFCWDRITKNGSISFEKGMESGLEPACVNTCPARARIFGNMNDPNSEISYLLAKHSVRVQKKEIGTDPRVFYTNLDDESVFDDNKKMVL